jgi:hypothetical protein
MAQCHDTSRKSWARRVASLPRRADACGRRRVCRARRKRSVSTGFDSGFIRFIGSDHGHFGKLAKMREAPMDMPAGENYPPSPVRPGGRPHTQPRPLGRSSAKLRDARTIVRRNRTMVPLAERAADSTSL